MCYFMTCNAYTDDPYNRWKNIKENDYMKQLEAGKAIEKRFLERTVMIEIQEAGQAQLFDSTAQRDCKAMLQL